MLVLLPPSEGKRRGGDGPAVSLPGLSWAEPLTLVRRDVGETLRRLCRDEPARARTLLGLSEALDGDRVADAELWDSPTMPAAQRYAGVLYDALDHPGLPAAARRRAGDALVVFSGLWGATRPGDLLPAYRIGIGTRLPGIGALPAAWRPALLEALDAEVTRRGAIDLRSAGYRDMYRPSAAAAARVVTVTLVTAGTRRSPSSYATKVVKGRLTAAMLQRGTPDVERLLAAAAGLGLVATRRSGTAVEVALPPGWGTIAGVRAPDAP